MLGEEYDLQWQALRYAVDMIDLAWSYEFQYLTEAEREYKRAEMTKHRDALLKMQDEALNKARLFKRS